MSLHSELRNMIEHYEDLVQELNRAIGVASSRGHSFGDLIAKKTAYESEMLPDLRSLLKIAEIRQTSYLPNQKAQIVMKDEDGEYIYGTYDFNSILEKDAVNELARKLRKARKMGVEVRRL